MKKELKKNVNQQIKEFLKEHYLLEGKTTFGILIDGEWGAGKTFLINEIREELGKKAQFLYISLFGMTTMEQMNEKLYSVAHPVLTSKQFKFLLKLLKTSISAATKFEYKDEQTPKIKESDITFNLPFSLIPEDNDSRQVKTKKAIIVDDIERCEIPPQNILGYFSSLIIEKNAKVIFICNQTELLNRLKEEEKKEEYMRQKEKVIGMEFKILPDIENAIDYFLKFYCLENYKSILLDETEFVLKLTGCKNLRSVQQAYYYIFIILEYLNKNEYNRYENEISIFIRYFLVVFIAKTKGTLKNGDAIRDIINKFNVELKLVDLQDDIIPISKIPFINLFSQMIFEGKFDEKEICKEYEKIINPKDDESLYLSALRQNWTFFDDKKFKKYFCGIKKQLKNGDFSTFTDLWNYAELILELSKEGIIDETKESLIDDLKQYISNNQEKLKADILPDELNDMLYYDEEYQSVLVNSQDIVSLLVSESESLRRKKEKEKAERIINNPDENYESLINWIEGYKNADFQNSVDSLFKYIAVDEFYKTITKFDTEKQKKIADVFKNTYKNICQEDFVDTVYKNVILFERDNLEKIADSYERDAGDNQLMSPEHYSKILLSKKYRYIYKLATTAPKSWGK